MPLGPAQGLGADSGPYDECGKQAVRGGGLRGWSPLTRPTDLAACLRGRDGAWGAYVLARGDRVMVGYAAFGR